MNKQELLQYVDKKFKKKEHTSFNIGDTVRVHVKITEGDSSRVQVYEGVVIAFTGQGGARNFVARKISFGVGVERTFPLVSPAIEKIQVVRSGHVRRSKLYYLRDRAGKSARLTEKETNEAEPAKNSAGAVLSGAALGKQELAAAKVAVAKEK
jgi:large subunit ribosomal protein L19